MSKSRNLADLSSALTSTNGDVALTGDFSSADLSYTGSFTGSSSGTVNIGAGQIYKGTNGRVGIGTESPREKLDVNGYVYIAAGNQIQITGSPGTNGLQFIGQDNAASTIGTMSEQPLIFRTGATERLRLTDTGLGIGLGGSAPSTRLHIAGGSVLTDSWNSANKYGMYWRSGYVTANNYNLSIFNDQVSGGTYGGLSINAYEGVKFVTGTNDSTGERVRIDSTGKLGVGYTDLSGVAASGVAIAGNLGIGTSSPAYKLDVSGTAKANSLTISNDNLTFTGTGQRITGDFSNATVANRLAFQTSTTNGDTNLGLIPNGTSTTARLGIHNGSDLANCSLLNLVCSSTAAVINSAIYGTGTYLPMTFNTGGSERVRIDTSGNVGIGTSSPGSPLHVVGAGAFTDGIKNTVTNSILTVFGGTAYNTGAAVYLYGSTHATEADVLKLVTAGATRLLVNAAGNVGIGTSSPGRKFHVYGTGGTTAKVEGSGTSVYLQLACNGQNNAQSGYIGYTSAANLLLLTNDTERLRIDSVGNLTLRQSSNAANISVSFDTTVQNALILDASGNFGIGAASAGAKLHVDGSLNITGNTTLGDASTDTLTINAGTISIPNGQIATVSASQAEMEIGTEAALRSMSPLRVRQAIFAASAAVADLTLQSVSATLHRSPNAITAMFLYDTSKDSDGGAWTEKCQHTSWYNEPLSGKWLGAQASELGARCVNASLGPELITNGAFDSNLNGWTYTTGVWVHDSGKARHVAGTGSAINQAILTVGKIYQVTLTASGNTTSASVSVYLGSTLLENYRENGTKTWVGVATSSGIFDLYGNAAWDGSIDNISVKEVTAQTTATGDYFQLTTDGKFYKLNTTSGTTEVFRGNKKSFPKVAAIVAEASNVNIYDLTEPGRPMWMRFTQGTNNWLFSAASTVAAGNGVVVVGGSAGCCRFSFAADKGEIRTASGTSALRGYASNRNAGLSFSFLGAGGAIANANVNAVAMTVLPDAPVDSVTGLKVPTIAVATAGGVSVIRHDGSVVTAIPFNNTNIRYTSKFRLVTTGENGGTNFRYSDPPYTSFAGASAPFTLPGKYSPSTSPTGSSERYVYANYVRTSVGIIKQNNSAVAKSIDATITNTFNTGHLIGDIRRCFLSDITTGSVTGPGASIPAPAVYNSSCTISSSGDQHTISAIANGSIFASFNVGLAQNKCYEYVIDYVGSSKTITLFYIPAIGMTAGSLGSTYGQKRTVSVVTTSNSSLLIGFTGVIGDTITIRLVSVKEVIPDRSYKAAGANIYGTLTASAVNTGNSLVGYSGFSGSNYLQEPYSADLDFGTSEWSVGAWVNVPFDLSAAAWPSLGSELNTGTVFSTWTIQGTGVSVDGVTGVLTLTNPSSSAPIYRSLLFIGKAHSITTTVDSISGGAIRFGHSGGSNLTPDITSPGTYTFVVTRQTGGPGLSVRTSSTSVNAVVSAISVKEVAGTLTIADRAHSSGASIKVGILNGGFLTATAFDGTTTRTVTTTAAYNTATWLKARVNYSTDGTLAILVNGVQVASTTGTPLLSLSSRYNLLMYTETFGTNWEKSWCTVTEYSGTAPDSSNKAVLLTAGQSTHYLRYTTNQIANYTYTLSVYAKAGSQSWLSLRNLAANNNTNSYAWFNLSTGTVGTVQAGLTGATITDVGNGWYRCSITGTTLGTITNNLIDVYAASSDGVGASTGTIYIWGAQLVEGSIAKDYQRITTVAETNVAPLTIGNSYALDAPFPGSIALLKFSATVPTAEQAQFMYEQEKHLFSAGAKCVLPASTSVLDLAYDDATDTWSTLQATHESSWSGLVRTSTQTPSAGSFSRTAESSGVQLLARTTTNPGVDVRMPAKNLRSKDMPRDINQDIVVFDYFGGFTATTTNGSTALTSVASSLYPITTNLIGCAISGTGIPASTVITGISGTTIYMSKAATANGSTIQISTTDFNLPVGYTARAVMTAGTLKREGSTADYTKLFDGFRETIRYAVAPGYNAWVQIQAVKEVV